MKMGTILQNALRNRQPGRQVGGKYGQAAFLFGLACVSTLCFANTPMPWEGPICTVASSLKGQVAVVLSVVATIMIGIMFMYSETGGIVSRIAGWLLGLSMALSVASIITALFPGVAIPGCL